jgi:chromosome segregation ATPase
VAKEGALTNLRNAYALVSSNEDSRKDAHEEIERLTEELDIKITALSAASQKVVMSGAEIERLRAAAAVSAQANRELDNNLQSTLRQLRVLQESTVSKSECAATIARLEDERARLVSELDDVRAQCEQLTSEAESRLRTFEHQEEALARAQHELADVVKRNRLLRKKLHANGIAAAVDPDGEPREQPPCAACADLRQQLEALQRRFDRVASETSSFRDTIGSLDAALAAFFERLTEVGAVLQSDAVAQEATSVRELIAREDAVIGTKLSFVIKFALSLIDSIVFNLRRRSGETAEAKLLRASITQLERKVAELQGENAKKAEEIERIRAELAESYRTKDKYESEFASLTSFKGRTAPAAPQEVPAVKGDAQPRSAARTERRARATALSDSLALLDLLCQ